MSEHHRKLRHALDELQAQLDEMRQVDPDVATHLDAAIGQAQALLAGEQAEPEEQGSMIDQLAEAAQHYEASHPTLGGTLRSVVDALAQMGI